MPVLYLTEDDVRDLMDMETSIEVVDGVFQQLAAGAARNIPRARVNCDGILLHTMSAAAPYLGLVGWKAYTTTRRGARFHVGVYDAATGELTALIQADYLGQLRTGAASGVATEYMARPDSTTVGVFGSGKQARSQLKAVCCVRRVERAEVYSRNEEHRQRFADEMTEYCATDVVPVATPDQAAMDKDIIICATNSQVPIFEGPFAEPGTHLNVIGSNFLSKAEIDIETVRRSDIIVCDNIEQCKLEAGDFAAALESGVTDWRLIHELADVVVGRQTGRAHPEDVTLFKSVGLAIEDVAMAAKIVELARAEGVGRELPI